MLRHNQQRDRKLRFQLGNGDALVMAGEPSTASLLVQLAARQLDLQSHMRWKNSTLMQALGRVTEPLGRVREKLPGPESASWL